MTGKQTHFLDRLELDESSSLENEEYKTNVTLTLSTDI